MTAAASAQDPSSRPHVRVAAAIIAHDGRVLAAQRSYGMKDRWEFPGGKIEAGEQAEAAVRREVAEELGLRLGAVFPFSTVEFDYPDFHLSMELFMSSPAPGEEPERLEHEALRWLSRDELMSVDWLPADVEPVRELGVAWDELFDEMHL